MAAANASQLSTPVATPSLGGLVPPPSRGDLGGAPHLPRVVPADAHAANAADHDDGTYIWGTRIRVGVIAAAARTFLAAHPKHSAALARGAEDHSAGGVMLLDVDGAELADGAPELYARAVEYPREVLPLLDDAARELAGGGVYVTVRLYNLVTRHALRELGPEHVDTLVAVSGLVTRTSSTIPDLKAAHFRCERCGAGVDVLNLDGRVSEPEACTHCGARFASALIHNLSAFTNKQLVRLQERPDDMPEGDTPASVAAYVYDANVDAARPGDRVTFTGTFRAVPLRVNPRNRVLHAAFRTFLDVMHVETEGGGIGAGRGQAQDAGARRDQHRVAAAAAAPTASTPAPSVMTSPARSASSAQLGHPVHSVVAYPDEAAALSLTADPRLVSRLVASLAPGIYGLDDVKLGLLCQLFGGVPKTFPGGGVRGELHVLLVGDPSVSKSQLLGYMHALAPRGVYTSGRGSSATGLTAYVTRDPEGSAGGAAGDLVLESGALVLSDRGLCCIDEFDKMSDAARATLHETMEQQTVSVAKAGLVATLNARTAICAAANPVGSRYNPGLSVAENIGLPPSLLTRFDLIYLMLDTADEAADLRLARHLISVMGGGRGRMDDGAHPDGSAPIIPQAQLRAYVALARARPPPRITGPAADELARVYAGMRADGRARRAIVATPRQLESLVRLSEAYARMRLSTTVDPPDVAAATRLWFGAMAGAMTKGAGGGAGGGVDLDEMTTGLGAPRRAALAASLLPAELLSRIRACAGNGGATTVDDLLAALPAGGPEVRDQVLAALRQLSGVVALDERTGIVRPRVPTSTVAV